MTKTAGDGRAQRFGKGRVMVTTSMRICGSAARRRHRTQSWTATVRAGARMMQLSPLTRLPGWSAGPDRLPPAVRGHSCRETAGPAVVSGREDDSPTTRPAWSILTAEAVTRRSPEAFLQVQQGTVAVKAGGDVDVFERPEPLLRPWARNVRARPYAPVIGAFVTNAHNDPVFAQEYVTRLVRPRRDRARVVLDRAVDRGELDRGAPVETALDLLYGALFHRLLHRHAPLTDRFVTQVVDLTLDGLLASTDKTPGHRTARTTKADHE